MLVSTAAGNVLYDGMATGALWRPWDPRNYLMTMLPGVSEKLRTGFADNDEHLREHIWFTLNQGSTPSCCSHMAAGQSSGSEHIERKGEQILFDAMRLHNETG